MKTSATITITRKNKRIVIYINDGDWSKVPDLEFIADIELQEIIEIKEKKEKNHLFKWVIDKVRIYM